MRQTIQATLPPAGEFSQRPAVLHADSRHLQSHYRTDRKTDFTFAGHL